MHHVSISFSPNLLFKITCWLFTSHRTFIYITSFIDIDTIIKIPTNAFPINIFVSRTEKDLLGLSADIRIIAPSALPMFWQMSSIMDSVRCPCCQEQRSATGEE